jgi:ligand-binding sensor domain-containing protein
MRKSTVFHPLLATYLLMSSCSGQVPASTEGEATDPASALAQAPADTIQVAEYIVAAYEDSKGGLWFGTNGQGVARWDGNALRYFSTGEGLIDNVVTGIAEDRVGDLWFGTHAGVSRYDGTTFTGFGPAEGLVGSGCKVLVDRQGHVWAGTSAGVFRFAADRFTAFELPLPVIDSPSYKMNPGKVWALFEDSKGNLWFARDGYGACKYDGQAFTHFTKKDGLCSNNVASIAEDPQGHIWFGSITSDFPPINEGGVARYDPSASLRTDGETFTQFPDVKGLTANDVYNLYTDRAGHIWIGAVRVGAYRYDGKDFTFFDKTDRPDLTKYFGIQAFVEDHQGTLWFGFSGGLFRFNGNSFVNVTRGGSWSSP